MSTPGRPYWPIYVTLHWLSAIFVLAAFLIGLLSLANTPNDEQKMLPLALHIGLGLALMLLTLLRLWVRAQMGHPVHQIRLPAAAGKKPILLDLLSVYVKPLLYLMTFLMSVLGVWIALPANLFEIVFFHSGVPLPQDFYIYPARAWHGSISLVLMILIGQHILAFVFHQFIRGENFIGRMWFLPIKKKSREGEG
jgi:cytochrome b561